MGARKASGSQSVVSLAATFNPKIAADVARSGAALTRGRKISLLERASHNFLEFTKEVA